MNDEQLQTIRNHQGAAAVDVVPIAIDLGLQVYKVAAFPDDLCGMIRKEEEEKYAIHVNDSHHVHRRRFTIAHEIAHFLLHKELIGDGLVDDAMYRSGLGSSLESEANRLAADILMPWHLLNLPEYDHMSIKQKADAFMVSEASMAIRLGVPA